MSDEAVVVDDEPEEQPTSVVDMSDLSDLDLLEVNLTTRQTNELRLTSFDRARWKILRGKDEFRDIAQGEYVLNNEVRPMIVRKGCHTCTSFDRPMREYIDELLLQGFPAAWVWSTLDESDQDRASVQSLGRHRTRGHITTGLSTIADVLPENPTSADLGRASLKLYMHHTLAYIASNPEARLTGAELIKVMQLSEQERLDTSGQQLAQLTNLAHELRELLMDAMKMDKSVAEFVQGRLMQMPHLRTKILQLRAERDGVLEVEGEEAEDEDEVVGEVALH